MVAERPENLRPVRRETVEPHVSRQDRSHESGPSPKRGPIIRREPPQERRGQRGHYRDKEQGVREAAVKGEGLRLREERVGKYIQVRQQTECCAPERRLVASLSARRGLAHRSA